MAIHINDGDQFEYEHEGVVFSYRVTGDKLESLDDGSAFDLNTWFKENRVTRVANGRLFVCD